MLRAARYTFTAAAIALVLGACQDDAGPTEPTRSGGRPTMMLTAPLLTPPFLDSVVPSTDNSKWRAAHYIFLDPEARRRNRLFVHMPGAPNPPDQFVYLATEAARLGYHVIVLSYPNDQEIGICKADPVCQENVRLEVMDGIDRTPLIDVSRSNSIEGRLANLLQQLTNRPPDEGWSQFLNDGEPNWSQIVISGASFGGSEAAMLAKFHGVDRVTLFAAPRDTIPGGLPPGWVALGATPSERYYGLVHDRDPLVAATLASWPLLGMSQFGDPVYAESGAPFYAGTHRLLTDLRPSSGSFANAHPSVSRDLFTPLDPDGRPSLRDAWHYMLGGDIEPPRVTVPEDFAVNATSPAGAVVTYAASAIDHIDGPVPVRCRPATGSEFAIGRTTVTCEATDLSYNQASATFQVTVLGAEAQLGDLRKAVVGLGLVSHGITTSLTAKLDAALAAMNAGDVPTACAKVQDFINETRAQDGKKILTADAARLVADAQRIRAVLACVIA